VIRFAFASLVFLRSAASSGAAAPQSVPLEPTATFLTADVHDHASFPTIVDLQQHGVAAGSKIKLKAYGNFLWNQGQSLQGNRAVAVFSTTSEVLPKSELHRVPGAIASDAPTYVTAPTFGGTATDIPEDFQVGDVVVTVPAGAQFLMIGADDIFWSDNLDPEADFHVDLLPFPLTGLYGHSVATALYFPTYGAVYPTMPAGAPYAVDAGPGDPDLTFSATAHFDVDFQPDSIVIRIDDQGCCTQAASFNVLSFKLADFTFASAVLQYTNVANFDASRVFLHSPDELLVDLGGGLNLDGPDATIVVDVIVIPALAWMDFGTGLAGVNGIPKLAGTGTLTAGSAGSLALTLAKPSAPALLFLSLASHPVPFKGGILVAYPFVLTVTLATNAGGGIVLPFTWPSGVPSGTELYFQIAVQDAAAINGVSMSNGLNGLTP
jgi:hypothetical protein